MDYRDKLRLAQLLIQLARREEEVAHADRQSGAAAEKTDAEYVAERVLKLRPKSGKALLNSIDAMFQFRGGISDTEKRSLLAQLSQRHGISIEPTGRVAYRPE